ncbi:MAG: hypothetical protein RLZZ526_1135 [Actinomycetota bacterium]
MMRWVVVAALVAPFGWSRASADDSVPDGRDVPVITISKSISLTSTEASGIVAAARNAGAAGFPARYATFPMTAYSRGGEMLMQQPKGWRVPMGTRVLPVEYVRATGGDDMAEVLLGGRVLMGENSARIRDARVGDVVTLRDSGNRIRRFTVGMIVSNEYADGEDLIMSAEDGFSMGVRKISRVNIIGFSKPTDVYSALRRKGISLGRDYRLRTTWDLPNPDATLGLATVKLRLGEFAFQPTNSSAIKVEAKWGNENIVWGHRYSAIALRNNCHEKVVDDAEGALAEIAAKGLRSSIDVAVSNRYGGCFVGRYNRLAGLFGAPSRHAFGMAIDVNTDTNPQWGTPRMNCDVVRIFRKWGFAWGGNFWPSDGMHFEWVGERRDQMGYPSRYCPNKVPVPSTTVPSTSTSTTTSTSTSTTSTTTTTTPVPTTTTTTVPMTTTT